MCKIERGTWGDLVERLRRSGTRGDPELKPYVSAQISMESVRISDLVPLSKYVLSEQLEFITHLYQRLAPHGEDIFDLENGILWPDGKNELPITCPVVEEWENEGLLLVDGLHRVWVARELGRIEMACAVIRHVDVPLVPLPVTWEEVIVFPVGQKPAEEDKRTYRFSDSAALRTAMPSIASQVTEKNFRYFLYRDLDELGSSGIRPPAPVADPTNSREEQHRTEEENEH